MKRLFLMVALVLGTSGCVSRGVSLAGDVDPNGWNETITWIFPYTSDKPTRIDLSFAVRYGSDATPAKNVYVMEVFFPSGEHFNCPIELELTPVTDNNLHEARTVFLTGVTMAETGDYRFSVTPLQPTRGVWSVALDLVNDGQR